MKSIHNNPCSIRQGSCKYAPSYAILRVRDYIRVAALVLSGALVLLIYSSTSWAQTYYVDAVNGNDSWPGTLPDAQGTSGPWKTLSKVNNTYFVPGDSVLLKCGQTWNEQLVVTSSGVAGSPITYGAYGNCTGISKPVIDGSTPVNGWTAVGGGIYKATVPADVGTIKQVFLDGSFQDLAHYPNRGFIPGRPNNMFLAIFLPVNQSCGSAFPTSLTGGSDLVLTSVQEADVVGAGIHTRSNGWTIEDRTVTGFDPSTKTFSWVQDTINYALCKNWGYYLDNKLWMLDSPGEWYFDASSRQLYVMPVSGSPEGRVDVGHRSYGVYAKGRSNIVIEGLSIRKTDTGISADSGSNQTIRKTEIMDTANKAISVQNSPFSVIEGNNISNSARDGIWAENAHNSRINNNLIQNIGVVGSPRKSIAAIKMDCLFNVCGALGTRSVIASNRITNSGYSAILFGDQTTVSDNYIENSCMVLDDCGAIYTGGRNFPDYGARNYSQINNNIVFNVPGSLDGQPLANGSAAQGIYLDDYANSVTVAGNTVVNADNGIQIHNGASNIVKNNTIYGSRKRAVWMQENAGGPGSINSNHFSGNRYFQLNQEYTYLLSSSYSYDPIIFGKYDSNRYSLLYSEIVGTEQYSGVKPKRYPFQEWTVAKNDVGSTAFAAFGVAPAHVLRVNLPNEIRNSTFDVDPTMGGLNGWAKSNGDGSRTWEPICFTGRCLKLLSGTANTLFSSPNFSLYKDRHYRIRADLRGAQGGESIVLQVRANGVAPFEGGNAYSPLGLLKTVELTQDWQSYSFVFKATGTVTVDKSGARFDFEVAKTNQTVYLDNVLLEEVTAELNRVADDSVIVINPALTAQPKDCPDAGTNPDKCSQYAHFTDDTPVSWPITVAAMGSEIVVWNDNPFKDMDRDRIPDSNDLCPGTPASIPVNEHGCSFTQQHSSNLGITLTAPANVVVGDVMTYTITVNNAGPLSANNVVTSGSLPACSLGTIPNGGSATCTRSVSANAAGVLTQTVAVSATEMDPSLGNNTATVRISVIAAGLTGYYYDDTILKLTRVDPTVNFNWGYVSPDSTIGADTFGVRWTGFLQVPTTGSYTFYTTTDDGVRLWINGALLIDKWYPQAATEWRSPVTTLIAGQKVSIKMEYFENYGDASAQLRWSGPDIAKQIIPQSRLWSQ